MSHVHSNISFRYSANDEYRYKFFVGAVVHKILLEGKRREGLMFRFLRRAHFRLATPGSDKSSV